MKSDTDMERDDYAAVIRTPDQRLRVFVSSTLRELMEERKAAREAIRYLRLTPVLFELGARPHPPQNLYRAYLAQSHIFLGIYWQSYGWVAPDMGISGLEDEYRLARDLPKLIYIKTPAPDREQGLKDLLATIQSDDQVSYKYFSSTDELRELIANDLAVLLTERFEQADRNGRGAPWALGHLSGQQTESVPQEMLSRPALPRPLSNIIGRESEVKAVHHLLTDRDVRLVTLTGPGGVGKTRLALEVAARLEEHFPHGVYWVNLAPIREQNLVVSAIAQALDVHERDGHPLVQSVKEYLQDKRLLLLLDNFEQVLEAGPLLSELLAAAPECKALVTSRASLHLRGEQEFSVPPLQVPSPADGLSDQAYFASKQALFDLSNVFAIRLFVERAQAVRPNFQLSEENASYIAEIVRRLDGLPLAIELAAARMKLLSPQLLLDRLDNRLALLTGGAQDLPQRQQTMRNVIDWSHSLLSPEQQTLFAQLGIFVDGFTLDAAETVCMVDGSVNVLEDISSLLDNNLLHQQEALSEQPRFGMLGSIREYALEQLQEAGEDELLRQRHATFFSQLAEEAGPKLFSGESSVWLDRLEDDYGNLRSTLNFTQATPQFHEMGWRIMLNINWFWYRRSYLNEARQWYARAIEQTAQLGQNVLRACIINYAGLIAMWQSDLRTAAHLMDESLQIVRAVGDDSDLATVLFPRGVLAINQGDAAQAFQIFAEALPLFEATGQEWFQAMIHLHLGNAAFAQGDLGTAQTRTKKAYSLGQRVGDRWIVASAVNNFGELARYQDELGDAERFYLESRMLFEEVRSSSDVARANNSLAWIALAGGETARAQTLFSQAMALQQQLGVKRGVIEALAGLAAVQGVQGQSSTPGCSQTRQWEDSVRILSFVRAEIESIAVGVWPADARDLERNLATAKAQLGETKFSAAYEAGRSLELAEALAAVRDID